MAGTLTTIRVDRKLADEAMHLFGAKSRTEAVRIALQEFLALKDFKKVMKEYGGKGKFAGVDE